MATPEWLGEGAAVWDPDDERWVVHEVGPKWVVVQNPDRGRHKLLQQDLVEWVEDGEWKVL